MDIYDKIQSGEISLDDALNPGKALHDVDVSRLPIDIMSSGFDTLDREFMILKKREGELIIVAARPSMGKSALVFQMALHVSKTQHAHVFSLEMSQESVVRRLISTIINRPITAIQMGLVPPEILQKACDQLKKYNYTIDDSGGLTADDICDRATMRAKTQKTGLIVIDHLQIVKRDKGHSVHTELGEITTKFKNLAKDLKCPVLVACQLNRQCEMRENKRPILSDLKESGSIEENADLVMGIYREYYYTQMRADEADLLVLKNRNGQTGETVLKFYGAQSRFEDLGNSDI